MGSNKNAGSGRRSGSRAGTASVVPDDKESLERDIERTREQLGDAVGQLAAKADIKAMAAKKATELSDRVKGKAGHVRRQARDRLAATGQVVKGAAGPRQASIPLGLAVSAVILGYLAIRQWRNR